jgi:hypothetical protein
MGQGRGFTAKIELFEPERDVKKAPDRRPEGA